jgi:hypothetical protein
MPGILRTMKNVAVTILCLCAVGTVSLTAPAATDATRRATLQLIDRDPLTLKGSRFRARERVRVTVTLNGHAYVRWTRASRPGTFAVRFGDVHVDRCSGFIARANGNGGSRASYKLPQPQCPPPL